MGQAVQPPLSAGKEGRANRPLVVVLCTGNAARSPMVEAMLVSAHAPVRVLSAGTHVVENQPISLRTRDALAQVGFSSPRHRSRQLTAAHVEHADLIVAMACEHVLFVRRRYPGAAAKTATMRWLADHLPLGPGSVVERVRALGLADVDPRHQGDVADPAGGDLEAYVACARELAELVEQLVPRLAGARDEEV